MEIKKCIGCGSLLQTSNKDNIGYIPLNKYENSYYCQRCFQLIHYNKKGLSDTLVDDNKIIDIVNDSKTYAFFLIDLFNINEETINTYKKININKSLVISKCDLIINDLSIDKIKDNIKSIYGIDDNIIFLSSTKNKNINLIFRELDRNNKKNCYILGYTNAGKSTLINTLKEDSKITTSNLLNTTLDFIEMDINGYRIIDTPGFSYHNTIYEKDDYDLIKRINTKYFVRPITYQSKLDQIFKIEDKLFLKDFNYNSITFYMSNLIKIKKVYKDCDINYKEIKIDDNTDIVISSLGFINVKKKCIFKVNSKYYDLISIRKSIIK